MIKKLSLIGAALAMTAGAVLPATAANAQSYGSRYGSRYDQNYYGRDYRGQDNTYRYQQQRKCSDGTTGAIIGAIAGGLLGRVIDRGGDRSTGTLLGAGGGALAGRAIDRDGAKRAEYDGRCYR